MCTFSFGILIAVALGFNSDGYQIRLTETRSVDTTESSYSGIDYFHFWFVPRAQRQDDISSVYFATEHARIIDFANELSTRQDSPRFASHLIQNQQLYSSNLEPTGSPFFYSVTGLCQIGKYELDYMCFQVLSCLLCLVGVALIGRVFNLGYATILAFAALLVLTYRPLQIDISVANVNRLQLFLFGTYCWLIHRERIALAAIWLGFAIAFKMNFVFVAGFACCAMALTRNWQMLLKFSLGLVVGVVIGIGIGGAYFGSMSSWLHWRQYLAQFIKDIPPIAEGNYSFLALIQSGSSIYTAIVAGVSMLLFFGIAPKLQHQPKPQRLVTCSIQGLLVFLLSSPLVWSHYYVLAIPAMTIVLANWSGESDQIKGRLLGAIAFAVLFVPCIAATFLDPLMITVLLQSGTWLLFFSITALQSHHRQKENS